ncbi:uncharacterized protein BCR38DRAFT_354067 [Pseudomassariella vexata]|uniref:Alpha-ketoglutarate-dependent sulfonate dioxygenase n=1 Tax=Pseudomassariella vexata TaxID=1141098 RepID=A0A1Y2DFD7_9PEZI|nr:uncharacterized protein BCR38DRAFT_354067 [Pseudomassariella vexata]ORY57814.1 hypothetical protein BCR38DRAFT_354067 [Pseudomassariella vexata]
MDVKDGYAKTGPPVEHAHNGADPPAYTPVAGGAPPNSGLPKKLAPELSPEALAELNSAFASLSVPTLATKPTADTCLAHLKLLSAFQSLKEDVGYTDGLWDIYDSHSVTENRDSVEPGVDLAAILAKLREKRWAVYIARAVDRYEAWWNSFVADPLIASDMEGDSPKYLGFPDINAATNWTALMLPPLDVLMVWHAHMLNPRVYLEDCMRYGLKGLWNGGMPWKMVNEAIDTSFNYTASEECIKAWNKTTGREWDNTADSITKSLRCPACAEPHQVPWTTCRGPGLVGDGYGDGEFSYTCFRCATVINGELLEVAKFVKDVKDLLAKDCPMPGTILDFKTGKPEQLTARDSQVFPQERLFPNRLLQRYLRSAILELVDPGRESPASMEDVRVLIEDAIKDQAVLKKVEGIEGLKFRGYYRLTTEGRISIRKMMSRYWGNFSPFSLELGGAVLRQGIFAEKMHKIDWLHSPTAKDTMDRLIIKYQRFFQMMGANRDHILVPTLDVDLAWHTHQLSPAVYYQYTVAKTQVFTDHDDKISEDKLSAAFEWTSRTYQADFGEVYSECTCWYCESIRSSHISSMGKLLGVSKNEKIAENFYTSGQANMCPPDKSAHISAHNAVKMDTDVSRDSIQAATYRSVHLAQVARIDENYKKAKRRAAKKGRTIPPRDEYYYYWGYPYMVYGPWMYPVTPGFYYADPCTAAIGSGGTGACAGGTCGSGGAAGACAGAAAGGCGGPGGCGAGGCGASGGSSGGGCGGGA